MDSGPTVREAGPGDVPTIVAWNLAEFPHGFFARLGGRFLSVYYRTFAASPHAVVLVAVMHGTAVGYVAATLDARAHRQHMLQNHRGPLLRAGLLALCRRPALAIRFVAARAPRYVRRVFLHRPVASRGAGVTGTVDHVAVAPSARRCGIGRLLLDAVEDRARRAGTDSLMLVAEDTPALSAFYTRNRWSWCGPGLDVDGRVLHRWELRLAPPAGSAHAPDLSDRA